MFLFQFFFANCPQVSHPLSGTLHTTDWMRYFLTSRFESIHSTILHFFPKRWVAGWECLKIPKGLYFGQLIKSLCKMKSAKLFMKWGLKDVGNLVQSKFYYQHVLNFSITFSNLEWTTKGSTCGCRGGCTKSWKVLDCSRFQDFVKELHDKYK